MGFFAALAGAVLPGLVGGLFDRESAKDQQEHAEDFSVERYALERGDFLKDRKHAEAYAAGLLRRDRRYFGKMLGRERAYAGRVAGRERRQELADFARERRAFRADRGSERRYAERKLGQDRLYMEDMRAEDRARFIKAQARNQRQSDYAAERTAESRGVDFAKLRDDAIAAGFNPLTAMSMAHAYSTEVDYTNRREMWNGDTAYRISGDGRRPQSAFGGGVGGATAGGAGGGGYPMAPGAPTGGFMSSGGGYQSTFNPALSSGGFIREALERGVDTYFNTPSPADDAVAQNVMAQVQAGVLEREAEARMVKPDFGFDMTKVEPYRPAIGVTNPPMDRSNAPDPYHNRPVEELSVSDTPVTGIFDLGDGKKARGLSPDLDWSEVAQMGNEAWLAMNAAPGLLRRGKSYLDKRFEMQTGIAPYFGPFGRPSYTPGAAMDPKAYDPIGYY